MSWNPVLNFVSQVKKEFCQKYGENALFCYDRTKQTALEYWINKLNNETYSGILSGLILEEKGDYLLFHYIDIARIAPMERTLFSDFWNMYHGIFMECRSVVIDVRNEELVLVPFKKFRNLNECPENTLDIVKEKLRTAKVVEFSDKLDGSMISAGWYRGEIVMSSSRVLNEEKCFQLRDAKKRFLSDNHKAMIKENPDFTFIFEYLSKEDAHVVQYTKEGLFLIGLRNKNTGEELCYREVRDMAKKHNVPCTEVFSTSLDAVLASLGEKKSNEAEGFVLNIDGWRIKIKYDDYVNVHKILSDASSANVVIRAIADDKFDDLISKVPEAHYNRIMETANKIFAYMAQTESAVTQYYNEAPKADRKTFMIWVEQNVPKHLNKYVKNTYLGIPFHYLKTGYGENSGYKKMHELRVSGESDYEREV